MSDKTSKSDTVKTDNGVDDRQTIQDTGKGESSRRKIPPIVINRTDDDTPPQGTALINKIKTRYSEAVGTPLGGLTVAHEIQIRQLNFKVETITEIYEEVAQAMSSESDITNEELDGQKDSVEQEWAELLALQGTLIEHIPHDHPYLVNGVFEQAAATKRQCLKLISKLKGQLARKTQATSDSPSRQHQDQLKRLEPKPFDGNPSAWKEFSELFWSLIGSQLTIPPVMKLIRLKNCLRGPPAVLISTLDINDQNFEKAWQKLTRKYDDPRVVAQCLFNRVLELPKIVKATEDNLTKNAAAAVETLDQLQEVNGLTQANLAEQLIAHLLRQSLDAETLRQWELKLGDSKDFPSLKEFVVFIEACARGIKAGAKLHSTQEITNPSKKPKKRNAYAAATQQQEDSNAENNLPKNCCAMCKERHFIADCKKFKELTPINRNELAMSKGLCFSCLGPHQKIKCTSSKRCLTCQGHHHTLIHGGSQYTNGPPRPRRDAEAPSQADKTLEEGVDWAAPKPSTSTAAVNLNNQLTSENAESTQREANQQSVLLATARVRAKSPRGFTSRARVLIDQGSEVSFISEKLVHQLRLPRKSTTLELIGIGGVNSGHTRGMVSVVLQSINGSKQVTINAHILKKLTAILPSFSCESADIGSLENLQLADQQYLRPGPIDIIVGADNYGRIISDEVVKSKHTRVVGQLTAFGWILSGPINCPARSTRISLSAVRESSNERLIELLQKFWVQEELPVQRSENSELSPDELECEKHFMSTHSRDSTGRYIVRLPLKTSTEALGESKFKASRQLRSIVSKLNGNPAYAQLYKEFINEYESLGHMQRASNTPEPSPVYYLPHHGVLREDAITTKLRVVFNGSSPSSSDQCHGRIDMVKIQETLPNATWRHVSGKENPADCASRGISPSQLAVHHRWWSGPDWINQDPEDWPLSTIDAPAMDTPEVAKEAKPVRAHPVAPKVNEIAELLTRYNTMAKLLAVSATINRAIDRFRRRPTPPGPVPSTRELNDARLFWVKITQNQYFVSAIRVLGRDQQLPRSHQLAKLTPILDEVGILRLGGRLKNSELDPEEIHPIILPRQSRFTTLVIEEAHRRTLHGGTQLTLAYTRQRYWIIGGRGTVRAYIQRCAICTRHRGKPAQQQMGQLPVTRVSPARAFLHTGVDYAGPFPILKWRPTNAQPGQVHIAVFVCFTTSAIHLELVNRQTTEAFIAAYKRFTGRRGIPAVMYSDNATTFTGAADVLKKLYHQASKENQQIQAALATNGTQWSFSPPRAPHFGGKWEAAVKSTKHHLKRVLGTSTLTFEELNTILVQIEACLNSRPICPMSDDPEDLQVLTPGHFLIGEPLQLLPEPSYADENPSKIRRWNLVTQKINQFWTRWSKECLQRYQSIYKWKTRQQNIEVGNIVLMMEDSFPPTQWPIARVIATKPGADGLTRVATVRISKVEVGRHPDGSPNPQNIKTTHSEFDRPIAKLCLLPTDPPPPEQPPEDDQPEEEEDQQNET